MKPSKAIPTALALVLLFTGCTGSYLSPSGGAEIPPVQDSSAAVTSTTAALYFRYYDEPMLARTNIVIDTAQQQLPEYYAVSALLNGPSVQHPDLTGCFGGNTRLISVTGSGEYCSVTLSDEFLQDTRANTPEQTNLKRRLAVYSVVNTVCEMGQYSLVQLYFYRDGNAQRPSLQEVGLSAGGEQQLLGPLARNVDCILTPSNVVKTALSCYSEQRFDRLYYYLGDMPGAAVTMPVLAEEFSGQMTYRNLVMTEYTAAENYTVDDSCSLALVQVSFKIKNSSASYSVTDVPIQLFRQNQCWHISYENFLRFLEVGQ